MNGDFRSSLGQFGLLGALCVALAAAYAVMEPLQPTGSDTQRSTFATVGKDRGACTSFTGQACRPSKEANGAEMLRVRSVESTSFNLLNRD